jgi:hypothetical protein
LRWIHNTAIKICSLSRSFAKLEVFCSNEKSEDPVADKQGNILDWSSIVLNENWLSAEEGLQITEHVGGKEKRVSVTNAGDICLSHDRRSFFYRLVGGALTFIWSTDYLIGPPIAHRLTAVSRGEQ